MKCHLPVLFSACTALFILSSCSSSSSSDPTTNPGILSGPITLPFRITSIETDVENDGIIDADTSYAYDADGRIINRTIRFPGTARSDRTKDFLYSGGNLVEIVSGSTITSLTYTDGLLTNYQFTDMAFEESGMYTYDNSGRLVGVTGDHHLFEDDDCDMDFLNPDDQSRGQNLSLIYSNNQISLIESSDNVVKQSYEYNASGLITSINNTYACSGSDFVSELTIDFTYDDGGLPASSVLTAPDYINESVITRDEAGRAIKIVITQFNRFDNSVEDVTTEIISYNDRGLPVSIASSTQPSSPFTPDSTSTINYEEQSCRVAYSANPLKLVSTGALINTALVENDPATCLYPLDQIAFN